MLIGYADALSVRPGGRVNVHVSSDRGSVSSRVLRHGGPGPHVTIGPVARFTAVDAGTLATAPVEVRATAAGSYATAALGGALAGHERLTVALRFQASGASVEQILWSVADAAGTVVVEAGITAAGELFVAGGERRHVAAAVSPREWQLLVVGLDGPTGDVHVHRRQLSRRRPARHVTAARIGPFDLAAATTLALAASASRTQPRRCFAGKLADPAVLGELLDAPAAAGLDGLAPLTDRTPLLAWDLGADHASDTVVADAGPDLQLHNGPTRAVTGPRWTSDVDDFRSAPEAYGAIHFHPSDLDDCRWPVTVAWDVPPSAVPGLHIIELTAAGETDHVPIVVLPPAPRARVVVLLSTFTYLAYANERLGRDMVPPWPGWSPAGDPRDALLAAHPEWGRSLYDVHDDGSGVAQSSLLRPIPNLRLDYRTWFVDGERHLAADALLLEWLEREGVDVEVLTDHDLDERGVEALLPGQVIVTSSHPEYVSGRMLDALDEHVAGGGRLMYLGGNGFYWVTDVTGARRQRVEVRRGQKGTRAWESPAGEQRQSTSGHPGGLWRHRGRGPNALTGVGFTAQGWDGASRPYERRAGAEHDWVFAGVPSTFGARGRSMGAAAGDEIDRADPARGTPPEAVVLASATGFSDAYQLVVEDVPEMITGTGGTAHPDVRADLTLTPWPAGGAVFATGSIGWISALAIDDFANDVARLTGNVLRRFLDPSPLP